MMPILLNSGFVKIYTVGIFLMLAFFWALFWFWRNMKRTSYREEDVFDALFISLGGGLLVARIVHVALNFQEFGYSALKFILINGYPGLSLVGGLIGGCVTLYIYNRYTKDSFMEIMVYTIPSLFLALGIGKLGALFGGSTVGTITTLPLGVTYVGYEGSRHAVALYEAILFFIGFFASQKLMLTYRRDALEESSLFSFFVMYTSLVLMALDFLKDDVIYLLSLRFNVLVPGVLFISFGLWEALKHKNTLRKWLLSVTKRRKNENSQSLNTEPVSGA